MRNVIIGIDFGSTKTLVAWVNPSTSQAEVLRLGRSQDSIPTTAYVTPGGQVHFGDDADDHVTDGNGTYLKGFKMKLGSEKKLCLYKTPSGEYRALSAYEVTRDFFSYVRKLVIERYIKENSTITVSITIPVDFSPARKADLKRAAHDAGFENVSYITEPEAAGIAYCRLHRDRAFKGKALVVDWGGGTLDLALVTRCHDVIVGHPEFRCGDDTCGGMVFDALLWDYVSHELQNNAPDGRLAGHEVRKKKESLSAAESVTLFLTGNTGACCLDVKRQTFNTIIKDPVECAVEKIKGLLKRIEVKEPENKPEIILLVGGSSQIPYIREKIEQYLDLPVCICKNAHQVVALGAAMYHAPVRAKVKGVVDLCFLLDATGSMQPCINAVKQHIRAFIQNMLSPTSNGGVSISSWRACVCSYKDAIYEPQHGREWLDMNDFTDNVDVLYQQLDKIKAEGGGDEPESLLDALYAVISRGKTERGAAPQSGKWRYAGDAARCIVVLTDAPFHPTMANSNVGVDDIINLIQQERIRLSIFAPEMACLYQLAVADRCSYDAIELPEGDTSTKSAQHALKAYTENVENFSKVMEMLAKSVSQSAAIDVEEV